MLRLLGIPNMKSSVGLLSNVAWALRVVWQSGRALTVATAILVILNGILPLAALYLMKLAIDSVSAGLTGIDKTAAWGEVASLVALLGCVFLLEAVFSSLASLVNTAHAEIVTDRMHDILHSKSLEMDLEYYENSQYYDTLHRAQQEAPYRPTQILTSLLQLGQSGTSLIAITGLLLSFHWIVPILLLCAAIPGLLVRFLFAGKFFLWQRAKTAAERQAWYFNWMLSRDTHAKEIRLFNLGGLFAGRFQNLRAQIRQEKLRLTTRRSFAELATQLGSIVATIGVYAFLVKGALYGLVTLGDLVMFFQAAQRGQAYLNQFFGSIAGLYENNLFLSNVQEFLSLKPKIVEPICPKPLPHPAQKGIALHNVSFQYPNSDKKVLEDINLTIRPGEHIALVGENGAGKTTLIKLLCRLYDPTGGIITFDEIDLRDLRLRDLRQQISVVFQDYARYQQTARDNIWFGNIGLPPDDERISEAAHQAGAAEVIAGLRDGYGTMLGKWFENGEELSIGEWQKIALARALLRQSQIVVLDEPTSFMDAKAEYEFFERFHRLMKHRTALLISHRLSTVRMADCIYVLDGGKIVESGTHDRLVCRGGRYASLFETQAQYYR
jgi:ATP-binding cassette subfamily B protein